MKLPHLNELQSSMMDSALTHFDTGAEDLDRAKRYVKNAQREFSTTQALLAHLKREVPALARFGRRLARKAQLLQEPEAKAKKGARGKKPQVAAHSTKKGTK